MARRGPLLAGGIVTAGAVGGIALFLTVQTRPAIGFALWAALLLAIGFACYAWYHSPAHQWEEAAESAPVRRAEREADRSRAELRRLRGLRRSELMTKYQNDADLVERIVLGAYWQGQSTQQLQDALGNPADVVARVIRGQRREIWKYHPTGGNRYALWITLEHDAVTGWENRA